jgi:hypothetical protein
MSLDQAARRLIIHGTPANSTPGEKAVGDIAGAGVGLVGSEARRAASSVVEHLTFNPYRLIPTRAWAFLDGLVSGSVVAPVCPTVSSISRRAPS